jgi:hypothetical protein
LHHFEAKDLSSKEKLKDQNIFVFNFSMPKKEQISNFFQPNQNAQTF